MIRLDREALICDLAETYHIYDMRSLPARRVATFAVGLREDSRIKKKISGIEYPYQELLLARIADKLSALLWCYGLYGDEDRPPSIFDAMIGRAREEPKSEFKGYGSGADFITAWDE